MSVNNGAFRHLDALGQIIQLDPVAPEPQQRRRCRNLGGTGACGSFITLASMFTANAA